MTAIGGAHDAALRAAMFCHLDSLCHANDDRPLRSADINAFVFDGRARRLVVQSGIWKPADLEAALTIRTTYTAPDRLPPYIDAIDETGLSTYKYRGSDPGHSDNRALRAAMTGNAPLAYFYGVAPGVYSAIYPVWIVGESQARSEFSVAVEGVQRVADVSSLPPLQREYFQRLTKERVHQRLFRTQVLHAYEDRCAMCRLRHRRLLDAAHIIPDGERGGEPVVPNGLSLCKIQHAAYDANLLGVRPDLVVEVQRLFRYLRGEPRPGPAQVTTIESSTLKLGLPA